MDFGLLRCSRHNLYGMKIHNGDKISLIIGKTFEIASLQREGLL
jgi:hypothetical protein